MTTLASAAIQTFQQQWHPGVPVQEAAAPRRIGTILSVAGTGNSAVITVAFTGRPAANFRTYQLMLL